ncbi:hypothetical protein ABZ383_31080 [Streptomyces sp. NPDC005900]|uniref:hypothetical protein n=1 Tax=Streptomyces sp. NPDC005900 TaxID=3154569 RepID=UPI0033C70610
MAAQLAATVYVQDPQTHQTVELAPGTSPEPRLAALVTNPGAWVDGKLPRAAKTPAEADTGTSTGPDGASGDDSEADKAPATPKPAARRSAATKPARGRDAADEGTSGE